MAEQLASLNKGELFRYSTSPVKIGVWIDGRDVFRRAFAIPSCAAGGYAEIASIPNIIPINVYGYATASGAINPLPYSGRGVYNGFLTDAVFIAYTSASKLTVYTGSQKAIDGGYAVVEYLETT